MLPLTHLQILVPQSPTCQMPTQQLQPKLQKQIVTTTTASVPTTLTQQLPSSSSTISSSTRYMTSTSILSSNIIVQNTTMLIPLTSSCILRPFMAVSKNSVTTKQPTPPAKECQSLWNPPTPIEDLWLGTTLRRPRICT